METTRKDDYRFQKAELTAMRGKAAKPLLYLSLTSMFTLFSGLTSAYIVKSNSGNWLLFNLPEMFLLSTAIIIISSITMFMAQQAIIKDNYRLTTAALAITLILGISFSFTQISAWQQMIKEGIYFVGKHSNASGSFVYVISLMHLLHVIGGIIALLVTFVKTLLKRYSSQDYLGIKLTAIYWHFLDAVWLYLFVFLYFNR